MFVYLHNQRKCKLLSNTLRQHSLPFKASNQAEMESMGAMSEVNWNSFNAMIPVDEAEYMLQLLGNYPNEQDSDPSFGHMFWSGNEATNMAGADESSNYCSSDMVNSSNLYCWSQWNGSSLSIPTSNYENYYFGDANAATLMNKNHMTVDMCMVDEMNTSSSLRVVPDNLFEDTVCLNDEMSNDNLGEFNANLSEAAVIPNQISQPKRKMPEQQYDKTIIDNNDTSESPKKKPRVSGNVQKNGRNVQSKKQKIVKAADEEERSAALNGQSSSSCFSEDDSNTSQEINGASSSSKGAAIVNLNGKERATRGSATDPQSLYARKRRERINERLKTLQNLVPNGTKVDISTMLEEAVQYVKFLQLQIKLLSSDDLWMYAPIAYNGMDIGLDLKIAASR